MKTNPNNLPVKKGTGALCPVDPLYCSRFKDHECCNEDSGELAWVEWERDYADSKTE